MKPRILLLVVALILVTSLVTVKTVSADGCQVGDPNCPPAPFCPVNPAPLTPGYWMNHPEAWRYCFPNNSVPINEINVCCTDCEPCSCTGCTTLSKTEAISFMKLPVSTDKTYTMFPALIAAKLNRLAGADVSCINIKIMQAEAWMCAHPTGSGVLAQSDAWQNVGEALYLALDQYNNFGCTPTLP